MLGQGIWQIILGHPLLDPHSTPWVGDMYLSGDDICTST